MSKEVTFGHPPRGHTAILAYDSANDQWQAVYVDSSGRLQVDIATAEQIEVLVHGYIGGAWQKQPLQFGYSDTLAETKSNTDLAAGTNTLTGTIVPAGELWIVTQVTIAYIGTSPPNTQVNAIVGGVGVRVLWQEIPLSGKYYTENVCAVLAEDDYMQGRCDGATAHDVLSFAYLGYKMDIDL